MPWLGIHRQDKPLQPIDNVKHLQTAIYQVVSVLVTSDDTNLLAVPHILKSRYPSVTVTRQ